MQSPNPHTRSAVALALLLAALRRGRGAPRPRDDAAPVLATLASPAGSGADRLRAGDLAGARAVFEAALAQDPDRLSALNDLAVSYVLDGHGDAARRLLDEVVASGSPAEQQAALVNLGELYAAGGVRLRRAGLPRDRARASIRAAPSRCTRSRCSPTRAGTSSRRSATLREALRRDDGGAARAALAYVYPEERVHLEALVAEAAGDPAARERWRELAAGRFAALAAAAERHLAGE